MWLEVRKLINLVKAEIKKIIKKKSFWVVSLIFILFCGLINIFYKYTDDIYEERIEIEELEDYNDTLDLNNSEELLEYVDNLTVIEINNLKKGYNNNGKYMVDNFLYDLVYQANSCKYIEKDSECEKENREEIKRLTKKIEANDWKYFTNLEIYNLKKGIEETNDEVVIKRYEELIRLEEFRLDNNIGYDKDNYLHEAIDIIKTDLTEYYNLKNSKNLNANEKERLEYLEEEMVTNNYIINHKLDLNNDSNLRAVLINFSEEFGLFIVIYVIMIAGPIVSDEFSRGTIKMLLTKPYKRRTILLSKLIAMLILIPLIILFMIFVEIIMGGIILGFASLKIPVLIYTASKLKIYSLFKYVFLALLSNMSMYLILSLIAFLLSVLTLSNSGAITITFLFYLVANVISNLAMVYKVGMFKYFVSLNWNFRYILDMQKNAYGLSLGFSSMVLTFYIILMVLMAFIIFDKRDVKNV